jgi:hypothetical protein
MKALLVMALASLCATAALADEIPTDVASQHTAIVEEYTYSTDLDIAKVVSMKTTRASVIFLITKSWVMVALTVNNLVS